MNNRVATILQWFIYCTILQVFQYSLEFASVTNHHINFFENIFIDVLKSAQCVKTILMKCIPVTLEVQLLQKLLHRGRLWGGLGSIACFKLNCWWRANTFKYVNKTGI